MNGKLLFMSRVNEHCACLLTHACLVISNELLSRRQNMRLLYQILADTRCPTRDGTE